jgi:hypothetical protein
MDNGIYWLRNGIVFKGDPGGILISYHLGSPRGCLNPHDDHLIELLFSGNAKYQLRELVLWGPVVSNAPQRGASLSGIAPMANRATTGPPKNYHIQLSHWLKMGGFLLDVVDVQKLVCDAQCLSMRQ